MGFTLLLVACTDAKRSEGESTRRQSKQGGGGGTKCLHISSDVEESTYKDNQTIPGDCIRIKPGCDVVKGKAFKGSNLNQMFVKYHEDPLELRLASFEGLGNTFKLIMECQEGGSGPDSDCGDGLLSQCDSINNNLTYCNIPLSCGCTTRPIRIQKATFLDTGVEVRRRYTSECLQMSTNVTQNQYEGNQTIPGHCVSIWPECDVVEEEAFTGSNLKQMLVKYRDEPLTLEDASFEDLGDEFELIMECEEGCGSLPNASGHCIDISSLRRMKQKCDVTVGSVSFCDVLLDDKCGCTTRPINFHEHAFGASESNETAGFVSYRCAPPPPPTPPSSPAPPLSPPPPSPPPPHSPPPPSPPPPPTRHTHAGEDGLHTRCTHEAGP